MKKLFNFVLVIFSLASISYSILLIREFVLTRQETIYNLPQIYKKYSFSNIADIFPNIIPYTSEEHNMTAAVHRTAESGSLILISRQNEDNFESISALNIGSCDISDYPSASYLRKIGVNRYLPSLSLYAFYEVEDGHVPIDQQTEITKLTYRLVKPIFSNHIYIITCNEIALHDTDRVSIEIMTMDDYNNNFEVPFMDLYLEFLNMKYIERSL